MQPLEGQITVHKPPVAATTNHYPENHYLKHMANNEAFRNTVRTEFVWKNTVLNAVKILKYIKSAALSVSDLLEIISTLSKKWENDLDPAFFVVEIT